MGTIGMNAVVGLPNEEWGFDPSSHAEMRPGAYDVHERVRDMNRNGILASMCFPSFAGFSARYFQEAADQDLALIMLKAYNDWHIDEWCAAYPGRFIPLAIAPVWNPDELVKEVRRVLEKGCNAVTMPELPHLQGLPSYHDLEYWGPFFQTCSEISKITWENSCRFFGWDPFKHISRPGATVRALRSLSPDVDTTVRSKREWRQLYEAAHARSIG